MSNLSSNKKYHYLYKTVNKVNGKYYYGMHSTNNLEDGYLGSGTALRAALRKYGKENFELTILEYFNSRESLVEAEKSLVTEQEISNKNCYNLKPGGKGGFTYEQSLESNKIAGQRTSQLWLENGEWAQKERVKRSKRVKELHRKGVYSHVNHATFLGKTHTPEARVKMSEAKKGKNTLHNNSQYGTCWITNGVDSKKVKHLSKIPKGWRLGRVIKK